MKNGGKIFIWILAAIVAIILVFLFLHPFKQTNNYKGFEQLHIGQESSLQGISAKLTNVTWNGRENYALLNVSYNHENTAEFVLGENQFADFGSNGGPYILVGKIQNSNSQSWAEVNITMQNVPESFVEAPNGGRNFHEQPNVNYIKNTTENSTPQDGFMREYGQNCKNREVNFTSPPVPIDSIGYIFPRGFNHGLPSDHAGIMPADTTSTTSNVPVLMPADGTIVNIEAMPVWFTYGFGIMYRVTISFSCRYFGIYFLIPKLSNKVQAAAVGLSSKENNMINVNISLKAGDIVGYIGDFSKDKNSPGVDWSMIDMNITPHYITPSLYNTEPWLVHTINPLSVYIGALRKELDSKSLRTVSPFGGRADYDMPGKLIGNWFLEGTDGYNNYGQQNYSAGHLAIYPDILDPSSIIVSIGNWQNASSSQGYGQAFVVVNKDVIDPSIVNASSGIVKYELKYDNYYLTASGSHWLDFSVPAKPLTVARDGKFAGTVAFQVLPGEKLRMEEFPGKTSNEVTGFTQSALTYYR
jgi:hypothetical protein